MIAVTQSKVVVRDSNDKIVQNGNCWAAAIASILELPLTEVPNFEVWFQWEDGLWWYLTLRFLNKKGYVIEVANRFRVFHMSEEEWNAFVTSGTINDVEPINKIDSVYLSYQELREQLKDQYYFVSGKSPRGVSHVTIWQNGAMVHDPHPTRDGILEQSTFEYIRPLSDEEKENVNDYKNHYSVAFPCHYRVQNTVTH